MNTKKIALLASLAMAVVPLASQAGTATAALEACVKSFTETYLPGHPVRQVKKVMPVEGPIRDYYKPRQYTIALSARGVRSGDVLAQARCVASSNGIVLVLDDPSPSEYLAQADFVVGLR